MLKSQLTQEALQHLANCPLKANKTILKETSLSSEFTILNNLFAYLVRHDLTDKQIATSITRTSALLSSLLDQTSEEIQELLVYTINELGTIFYKGRLHFALKHYTINLNIDAAGKHPNFWNRIIVLDDQINLGLENLIGLLQASCFSQRGFPVDKTLNLAIINHKLEVKEFPINKTKILEANKILRSFSTLWTNRTKIFNLYHCPNCVFSNNSYPCFGV